MRIAIQCFLNDTGSAEAAARTRVHHLVVKGWIDPALEPDERQVPQIAQPDSFSLRQRMTFRHRQDHSVLRELPMCQFLVPGCHRGSKSNIHTSGDDGFDLLRGE